MFKNIEALPFIGSKWRYRNKIYKILNDNKFDFNKKYNIYDIFGGSGSLYVMFKTMFPNSEIIFNDFDCIITDKEGNNIIDEKIEMANKIINEIKNNLTIKPNNGYKIEEPEKVNEVLNKCNEYLNNNQIIKRLIGSQLCFNSRQLKEKQKDYYDRFKKSDFQL